jgi:hypothetical protein
MPFLISSFKEIILTQHVGLDLLKRFGKLDRFVVVKHINVVMKWSEKDSSNYGIKGGTAANSNFLQSLNLVI